MSTEIQQQLEDLKKRVLDLEQAEIKLRIQSVGPRGPIGPPGHNGVGERGERGERGRDGVDGKSITGPSGRNGRDGETPSKEMLESIIVQLLQEYHFLDENCLPHVGPYAKK
jgi:hypothetical protein